MRSRGSRRLERPVSMETHCRHQRVVGFMSRGETKKYPDAVTADDSIFYCFLYFSFVRENRFSGPNRFCAAFFFTVVISSIIYLTRFKLH